MTADAATAALEWPSLDYAWWQPTRDTLHMYTQVLGKLRLALSPREPEWAHVTLFVTARGLTTSPIPIGARTFDAELDLLGHELVVRTSDGAMERMPLGGDVASFYVGTMQLLRALDIVVRISTLPSEVPDPIPFEEDHRHATYVAEQAATFFRVLSLVDVVMKEHRGRFRGRTTPVHFFWGSFDLSLARHAGPGKEEVCAGWWPGDERHRDAAFYAYGHPKPERIEEARIEPEAAEWDVGAGEFLLPYAVVRAAPDPKHAIRQFLESSYAATARLMNWSEELVSR